MENLIHRFRNNATAIPYANKAFEEALHSGLIDIRVHLRRGDRVEDHEGNRFINLCSCAYLGLQSHPAVIEGAIEALRQEGAINLSMSRVRIRLQLLEELEEELSALWRVRTITTLSASAGIAGVLPLIASGHLSDDGEPRVMVFDKYCHFSMNLIKPICADETTVLTCPHNDLDFLEDVCRKHPRVAYVADGVYSMGGAAPVQELMALQDRYGLMLFFDDSHSLSLWGERGEGYVRSFSDELSPLTVIVVSLNKGFGASGGAVMLGPKQHEAILARFGGPLSWSQGPNIPGIGAARASARIHASPELGLLQKRLHANIALFDQRIDSEQKGNGLPIKLIRTGEAERAVECSARVLEQGFYTSAVFFPIVEKGKAGLRVMIRADNSPESIGAPELLTCRSMLNTCGLHPRQYARALEIGADVVSLDLEDSVPPASREGVRRQMLPYLAGGLARRPGFTWGARINSLRTSDGLRDVLALLDSGAHPDALVLPKVESATEVRVYEELLCERLPAVCFLVVIETARGLAKVEEIAAATPRVQALVFGSADLAADLGATMEWEPMLYARSRIVVAAARAGIPAIDAPCFDLADDQALRREVERSRKLGFTGKVAVHPRQVPVINDGFTPSPREVAEARDVLAAVEKSRGQICVIDGRMIGPPAVVAARRTLARAGKLAY